MIERLLTHSNIFEVVGVDNYNSNYMKMKSQFLTQKEYCIPVYIIRRNVGGGIIRRIGSLYRYMVDGIIED